MDWNSLTEHTASNGGHSTFYVAGGPSDGPLLVFVHGWPELSRSWRHQLTAFARLGFRVIAPDMRGYGRSSIYDTHDAYAQAHVVQDMLHVLAAEGRERAVWVGHDWGSPTVWNLASHHPEQCAAVANLCVPYYTLERGLEVCVPLIDREVYPADEFPYGQWEYQRFYEENFSRATSVMDANPEAMVQALFRKGRPDGDGKPAATAFVRKQNGWFGGADSPPAIPRDDDVVTSEDIRAYAAGLERNGFFGPNSYYMNHIANAAYAATALNDGFLDLPTLFVGARYDYTCECVRSDLAQPMRERCRNFTERWLDCGHWMAQEKPVELNAILAKWLVNDAKVWPTPG